jgi:AAA+ ATPase superfamily predicted ATPase
VGGIPAYLRLLDSDLSLVENIQQVILEPGNILLAEPELLLHDELRDLSTYQAILRAISKGHHTLKAISDDCLIGSSGLTFHLNKLQELRLVKRRLPVTLTTAQQRKSKQGRYHLSDPFFRFYFRFLFPHLSSLMSPEETTAHIKSELRAFVGLSFEKLAQQWVAAQARAGQLPFAPEAVGSHWSRRVQVDVVAINHQNKEILLGECKWGEVKVNRQIVRELIEQKGPKVRQELRDGDDWTFHYAVFARAGFTETAAAELNARQGLLVDLPALDEGLTP